MTISSKSNKTANKTSSPLNEDKKVSNFLKSKAYFFNNSNMEYDSNRYESSCIDKKDMEDLIPGIEFDEFEEGSVFKEHKHKLIRLWGNRTLRIDFLMILILTLSALLSIYIAIMVIRKNFYKPSYSNVVRNEYSGYFYSIDVQRFQDSNNDGLGDYKGIERNIHYLKTMGVSTVVLTKIFIDRTEKHRSLHDLGHLVLSLHSNGITVICDMTPFVENSTVDSVGKQLLDFILFDAYYIHVDVNSSKTNDVLETLLSSSNISENRTVKSWYIGMSPINYDTIFQYSELWSMFNISQVKGFIYGINSFANLDQNNKNSVQSFYNFLFKLYQKVYVEQPSKEIVFYIDSIEKSVYGGDFYIYPYMYAALGFSPCKLMLKAGQEFLEGKHTGKNYTETMEVALKSGDSYLQFFSSLKEARDSKYFNPQKGWTIQTLGNSNFQAFSRESGEKTRKLISFYHMDKPTEFNLTSILQSLNLSKNIEFLHKRNNPMKADSNSTIMEHLNIYYAYTK